MTVTAVSLLAYSQLNQKVHTRPDGRLADL